MTENIISQQKQLEILLQIAKENKEINISIKDVLFLFVIVWRITLSDWKDYTTVERIVFLTIWSPLLWFLMALLVKV